jgi:putative tricarboxylic transport membrane protein
MGDTLTNLLMGFSSAFSPLNFFLACLGCFLGTIVGVLPGVGPLAGISLLLPITFKIDPTGGIILLCGVYYGAMYGGSTTSILMRMPGEAASVMTCIDGYAMARQGQAGPALAISAIGSYIAGTGAVIALMFVAPPLAEYALRFGPPEYFSLLTMGLIVMGYMTGGSMLKNLAMVVLGLLFGLVGIDTMSGEFRFSFGLATLGDGISIVPVAVGLFGLAEIFSSAGDPNRPEVVKTKFRDLLPSRDQLKRSAAPIGRGTLLGFLIGIIPGSAHIISTFLSYGIERRLSKTPERFGKGAIEGVAGPESANNAASTGALVPMLALGVPTGPIPAVLLAALMVHGITPGPLFITEHAETFWALIGSMYLGNFVLLLLNLPLIGLFVSFLRIPYKYLYPSILIFCIIGCYAENYNVVDVGIMAAMGLLGYVLRKFEYEPAGLVLGMVLAPIIERSLRQSLAMSHGSYAIFFYRPISLFFLLVTLILVITALVSVFRNTESLWRKRLTQSEKEEI